MPKKAAAAAVYVLEVLGEKEAEAVQAGPREWFVHGYGLDGRYVFADVETAQKYILRLCKR